MLEANRGYITQRHAIDGASGVYADTTAGWYFTVYELFTPAEAFAT